MPKIPKIKLSHKDPEKRVGAAFMMIGFIGLYGFLLFVWAGNPPDLPVLAGILLLLVIGLTMHRRARAARGGRPPASRPKGAPKQALKLPGLLKRKAKAPPPPPPPPPAPPRKKGLGRLLKRK